ncbi:MAG: type IV pilin N-terminal domain-containing protein [ANME-2 cluster archaeon]|nr:type IV pilin N-terminal domain-containing protein [ANME-2 cluster archaeon]
MDGLNIDNDSGISPVIGLILMTFLVVIFSAAVYAVVGSHSLIEPVIADIEIMGADVSDQEVVLVHRGGQSFNVSEISILISINGKTLEKNLIDLPVAGTPPGFLHSVGGVLWSTPTNQTHDNIWDPGDKGDFNIAGTNSDQFNPGDLLVVTIYHRPSGTIISSPERRI